MKTHFRLLFAAIILSIFSLPSFSQSNQLQKIIVKGNKFVSDDGQVFVFHGYNASDPDKLDEQGKWDKSYLEEMKKWGANIVRIPIHPTAWRKRGQEKYLELLDSGVQWATELGLYVIMDWHSIGNLRTEMYQADMYETTQKETFEFWRTMSQHYKGNNTVAFFEIYNEPTTFNDQLGTCTWQQWKVIVMDMITIIRANGSEAIPLVAGWNWAYDLTPVKDDPIEAKWTEDWGFVAENYPLILTEIGFCYQDERGAHIPVISDESYGDAITKYCSERGISWVVWVFDPNWSPMLFYDWTYKPTPQGVYFKDYLLNNP